jgi:hypothetical protein
MELKRRHHPIAPGIGGQAVLAKYLRSAGTPGSESQSNQCLSPVALNFLSFTVTSRMNLATRSINVVVAAIKETTPARRSDLTGGPCRMALWSLSVLLVLSDAERSAWNWR